MGEEEEEGRLEDVTMCVSLQALHQQGRANADHTTLLLNCYTKLKDIEQLDAFVAVSDSVCVCTCVRVCVCVMCGVCVMQEGHSSTFDVDTAIQVCRQANYHRHALALAKKYQNHNWSVVSLYPHTHTHTHTHSLTHTHTHTHTGICVFS